LCRGFGSCSHFARWLGDGSNLVGAPDNACLSHQMQHLLYLEEVRDELMANGCTGSSILVSLTNDASGAEDSGFESLFGHFCPSSQVHHEPLFLPALPPLHHFHHLIIILHTTCA
jgi:hypothetical protein